MKEVRKRSTKKKKGARLLSVLMAVVLCMTTVISMPGVSLHVKAAGQVALYIDDTADGTEELKTVYIDENASGKGWSWNYSEKKLTLTNFDGNYIEAYSGVNIYLKGNNKITLDPNRKKDGIVYGIKNDDIDEVNYNTLQFYTADGEESASLTITGDFGDEEITACLIDGGSYKSTSGTIVPKAIHFYGNNALTLTASGENATITGIKTPNCQISYDYKTNGNTSMNMDLQGKTGNGIDGILASCAKKDVTVKVKFSTDSDAYSKNAAVVGGVRMGGSGSVTITNDSNGGYAICGDSSIYPGSDLAFDDGSQGISTGVLTLNGRLFIYPTFAGVAGKSNGFYDTLHEQYGYSWKPKKFNQNTDRTGYYPVDHEGNEITHMKFERGNLDHLVIPYTEVHMTGLKVESTYSPFSSAQTPGSYGTDAVQLFRDVIGGSGRYNYSIVEGKLPFGLGLSDYGVGSTGGRIYGKPQDNTPAGSCVARISDASDPSKYVDVTITWDAVTGTPVPKYIKVGSVQFDTNDNSASGDGWSYAKSTGVLTLDNYNGGMISADQRISPLTIELKGNNTITLDETKRIGIDANSVDITSNDPNAKLTITGNMNSSSYAYGIKAPLTLKNASLDINLNGTNVCGTGSVKEQGNSHLNIDLYGNGVTGVTDSAFVEDTSELNIKVEGAWGYGIKEHLVTRTSAPVSVVADFNSKPHEYGHCVAIQKGLSISGSGDITIRNEHEGTYGYALWGDNATTENGASIGISTTNLGTITIDGKVFLGLLSTPNYRTHVVDTLHADQGYIFKYVKDDTYNKVGRVPYDSEGNEIIHMKFQKKEMNSFLMTYTDRTMTGLRIGENYNSRACEDDIYFPCAAIGGSGSLKYELVSGTLPKGLTLDTLSGYIYGTPLDYMEPIEGGYSAVVKVYDSENEALSKNVTIHWAGVEASVGTESVTLDPTTKTIAVGETQQLNATVLPANASCTDVGFTATNSGTVLNVDQSTLEKAQNVTTVFIVGVKPGTSTVTATTKEGNKTATCNVTVIEATPEAEAVLDDDGLHLKNLKIGATYTVDGTAYTANGAGYIKGLPSSLLGKTVEIIKTNTNAKYNSKAQTLSLEGMNIALNEDKVPVTDLEKTCTGKEQEPTFGGNLVKGTDYKVTYAVKSGEAGKLGTNKKPQGAGVYNVTVTGMGYYSGTFTKVMTITKKDGPKAPTNLTFVAVSVKGASDGQILGVTTAMEYSTSANFKSATKCTSTKITGLKAGTYYVRVAETETTKAGAYKAVAIPNGDGELAAAVTITGTTKYGETLTAEVTISSADSKLSNLTYQWYRVDPSTSAKTAITNATSTTYKTVKADIGKKICCEVTSSKESGTQEGITTETIQKADGPAAPTGISSTAPSAKGASDGTITGTKSGMEYSTDEDFGKSKNIKKITKTSVTGLAAGTYYVRIAETDTAKAGAAYKVIVSEGPDVLTGTVTISYSYLKYGQTLTAKVSGSNNTGAYKYQWKRVNPITNEETVISGATNSTYKIAKEDIGQKLACVVTSTVEIKEIKATTHSVIDKADGPGIPTSAQSYSASEHGKADGKITGVTTAIEWATKSDFSDSKVCTGTEITGLKAGTYYIRYKETDTTKVGQTRAISVVDGVSKLMGTVQITGTLKFGQTIWAKVTDSNNTGTLRYQWLRNGQKISGATTNSYTLTKDDIGQEISAIVASSVETGSISAKASSKIQKADGPAAPKGLKAVALSKAGAGDGKITGVTTSMEFSTTSDFKTKKVCTGSEITGLAAGTYYVRLAATDTTKAGLAAAITVADGPNALTGTVAINGALKYGATLTASVSDSNNSGDFKYQWKRDGKAINGATSDTYKIAKEDISKVLTCVVTSTKQTGSIIGVTGKEIEKADGPLAPNGLKAVATSAEGASDGKITGVTTAMEYSTSSDFKTKKVCTGTEITGLAAGTYYIRVAETDTKKAGQATAKTVPDGSKILSGTVTIKGAVKYGETLTATVSDSNNTGDFKYQWKRDGVAISNANTNTYKLVWDDLFKVITCEVTSTKLPGTIVGLTEGKVARADGPAAPTGLTTVAADEGASNGKILGVTAGMEYSTDEDFSNVINIVRVVGEQTEITGLKAGTYYVRIAMTDTTMAGAVAKVVVGEVKKEKTEDVTERFEDINKDDWFAGAVQFVFGKGIMNGVSDTRFAPLTILTREQFITVLYNMEGAPEIEFKPIFTDVQNGNDWFAKPVTWAYENGITSGVGNNLFGTGMEITREQLATLLYNYAQLKDEYKLTIDENAVANFPDADQISSWAGQSLKWAVTNGVMGGKAGNDGQNRLDPQGKATRAECAQMIKNLKERAVK